MICQGHSVHRAISPCWKRSEEKGLRKRQVDGFRRLDQRQSARGTIAGVISGVRNAAIVHLTKNLADQLGPHGITANLVHPGTTWTERSSAMYAERAQQEGVSSEEIIHRISQNNAIRRIVEAQEIGQVVTFLASPKAASITGVSIDASGGSIPVVFQ